MGIGHASSTLSNAVDWPAIKNLSAQQGLSAVVLDGIEIMSTDLRPPKELSLEWIGEVLQGYEIRYEQYIQTLKEMASFYSAHGLKMMVLKGYSCGILWPNPKHRPYGDIDIWLFGKQKEGDALVEADKRIMIDNSHHHHTVFYWHGFMVENHYDFINIHHHKSNREIEAILKDLGQDDSHYTLLDGQRIYLPSPNLHALFLLKHLSMHFASGEITLRQIMDWAFFVENKGGDVKWEWLTDILNKYGMSRFFSLINAICVEDLGFSQSLFPSENIEIELKKRVLSEILWPEYNSEKPTGLCPRIVWKYRRWRVNDWKHSLCYTDSRSSAFWSGVWSHLLKPSSI